MCEKKVKLLDDELVEKNFQLEIIELQGEKERLAEMLKVR